MSEATPDISKIISIIMENPRLIEEISAMAKSSGETKASTTEEKENADSSVSTSEEVASVSVEPTYTARGSDKNRTRLLSAFKPYLSSERARAVDSMISIADILDAMKAR